MKYTDDQIFDLFTKAPQEVQEMLSSQELLDAISSYREVYKLHLDTTGKIAELTRNLLLGITSPTEFYEELVLVGVNPTDAQKIVDDLNKKIFSPIREKMRTAPAESAAPMVVKEVAVAPVAPIPQVQEPVSMPVAPQSIPSTVRESVPTSPVISVAPKPEMRTMAHDVESMTSGAPTSPVVHAVPTPSEPLSVDASIPSPSSLPSERTVTLPPAPSVPLSQTPVPPEFQRTVPKTPRPDLHEVTSTLQKYGIDPYREPTD